ncbi:integrase catalytic domain-containing protein [Trichonephila clavipes]|nr:integrase catalytic domain-containing protein [Trichonephila clavipes]
MWESIEDDTTSITFDVQPIFRNDNSRLRPPSLFVIDCDLWFGIRWERLQSDDRRKFTAAAIEELTSQGPRCKITNGGHRYPTRQGSVERSNQDVEAMLEYFSFNRTIKRSPYKALCETVLKTGLQSSHISKDLIEKLVTEENLDLPLNQKDNYFTLTSKDLPAAFFWNNNDASASKDVPASE